MAFMLLNWVRVYYYVANLIVVSKEKLKFVIYSHLTKPHPLMLVSMKLFSQSTSTLCVDHVN